MPESLAARCSSVEFLAMTELPEPAAMRIIERMELCSFDSLADWIQGLFRIPEPTREVRLLAMLLTTEMLVRHERIQSRLLEEIDRAAG